ncbi:MAG: gamma-glutamylcyclotransferase [Candidatus Nephthysia bennettiae]|uniref:Putative gamma-glutamylcyclotransferase n=1 Tax=Candidatus Nephthysia bennettiae TaxID=3127016 RepID=A0A934KCE7_9BACT|nr:gamma-glutamylcyclotransferase [Candidatus Dormibacteraeota bacterium]MBJ7611290.1 gamma-glutamylcyclotransferase [Candidatus Dormibacteraeota bacterium]PZR98821.1 MAG: gamma-glutamylcyclotransferase [Candidatus Dormibacteraeota bacterium]
MPPPAGDEALLVYGSLLFPQVLQALLDRVPPWEPARAPGWRVAALPKRVYPGLVPGSGSASGLLLTGLMEPEWRTLIAFEGDLYDLRQLAISGGRDSWPFVWAETTPASPLDWVPEEFAERVLPAYVEGCAAWRRRYEATHSPSGRAAS